MLKIYESFPDFHDQFMDDSNKLAIILGRDAVIEHIGSTSVPGLIGKGIIDIAIGFDSLKQIDIANKKLLNSGYFAARHKTTKSGYIFLASTDADTTLGDIHLHLVLKNSNYFANFIKFRDILCSNPGIAEKYADFKNTVAKTTNNREEYTRQKSKFIEDVLGIDTEQ